MSQQGSFSAQKEKRKDEKKRDRSPRKRRDKDRAPRRGGEDRDRSPKRRGNVRDILGPPQSDLQPCYPPQQFTPLTASVSQVLYEVQHEKFLRWPSQMKTDPVKRDMTKYCDFHRDHRHRTDGCILLKKDIEFLIKCGHLRCYVAPEDQNRAPPPPPRQPAPAQHQQPLGEINVIFEGFPGVGESSSARKAHLCSSVQRKHVAQTWKKPCSSVQRRHEAYTLKEPCSSVQRRHRAQTSKKPCSSVHKGHGVQTTKEPGNSVHRRHEAQTTREPCSSVQRRHGAQSSSQVQ